MPYSPWSYCNDHLATFDCFFGNTPRRFPNAWTYTRSGATEATSVIDLWKHSNYYINYTHVSVRRPGNNTPHGYDWESKPGELTRTFHPRYALTGYGPDGYSGYGAVHDYYIRSGGAAIASGSDVAQSPTLQDALAAGLAEIESPVLTPAENDKLLALRSKLPAFTIASLDALYARWAATWARPEIAMHSDPRRYAESNEYGAFLDLCKRNGVSSWPYVFERIVAGDRYASVALLDLTLPEKAAVLDAVRAASAKERYATSGKYIVPSERANVLNFIKALLAQM